MPLNIETFSNVSGGNSLFKAIGHPAAMDRARELVARLQEAGPVAIYDPHGFLATFAAFHPLDRVDIAAIFVQDVEKVGRDLLGHATRPVTDLPALRSGSAGSWSGTVFVAAFDAARPIAHIRHLLPAADTAVLSLDAMRLPDEMLTDARTYLTALNFATNFVFLRDAGGHHTRVVHANYWGGYGRPGQKLYHCLFDGDGRVLAEWTDPLPHVNGTVVIDSREVRRRFALPEFTGSLFLHVIGA